MKTLYYRIYKNTKIQALLKSNSITLYLILLYWLRFLFFFDSHFDNSFDNSFDSVWNIVIPPVLTDSRSSACLLYHCTDTDTHPISYGQPFFWLYESSSIGKLNWFDASRWTQPLGKIYAIIQNRKYYWTNRAILKSSWT